MRQLSALIALLAAAPFASAAVLITEYMYDARGAAGRGEFVEFTNTGPGAVNLTGWSFDDSTRTPGSTSLTAFGTVQPGESVILTEATPAAFRNEWSLAASVKVVGGNPNNLGRNDEINLYDGSGGQPVDRLSYGDQDFPGSLRTQYVSAWVNASGLGRNDLSAWTLSAQNDVQRSWRSATGDIGSPGAHAIPEPLTLGLLAAGSLCLSGRRSRVR